MLPQAHIETAYQFLNAAEIYSAADAPLIKSEMLWCAAAHCVKAAANQYGLTNASHNDLFRVVRFWLDGFLNTRYEAPLALPATCIRICMRGNWMP